jgi:hypothetical protein
MEKIYEGLGGVLCHFGEAVKGHERERVGREEDKKK